MEENLILSRKSVEDNIGYFNRLSHDSKYELSYKRAFMNISIGLQELNILMLRDELNNKGKI